MFTIWVNLHDRPMPDDATPPSHVVQLLADVPAGVAAIHGRD